LSEAFLPGHRLAKVKATDKDLVWNWVDEGLAWNLVSKDLVWNWVDEGLVWNLVSKGLVWNLVSKDLVWNWVGKEIYIIFLKVYKLTTSKKSLYLDH
jgi:hypothetical protein